MCCLDASQREEARPSEATSYPERHFNRVTSDFYLGELDDEECHWTIKRSMVCSLFSAVIPATFKCCLATLSR